MKKQSTQQDTLVIDPEILADIAWCAGMHRYHSGDSRADIRMYFEWAAEFATYRVENPDTREVTYLGDDYLSAVSDFTDRKMAETGHAGQTTFADEDSVLSLAAGVAVSLNALNQIRNHKVRMGTEETDTYTIAAQLTNLLREFNVLPENLDAIKVQVPVKRSIVGEHRKRKTGTAQS